jgi:glucosamine-6-phosphate deaminase
LFIFHKVVNVHVASQDECSHLAAQLIATELVLEHPVIGLATGQSPIGVYAQLIKMYQQGDINLEHATWVMLDEFVSIESSDPRSFRQQLSKNFIDAFDPDCKKLIGPNLALNTPEAIHEDFMRTTKNLTLDLQILGIGRNGHIGFNEPGADASSRTHLVSLATTTVGDLDPAIWPSTDEPIRAVTRGIADINDTKVLILLAFGSAKAHAIRGALREPVSPKCPASFLREHTNLHVFVDNEAAALL